jgi:hypothetical protein
LIKLARPEDGDAGSPPRRPHSAPAGKFGPPKYGKPRKF